MPDMSGVFEEFVRQSPVLGAFVIIIIVVILLFQGRSNRHEKALREQNDKTIKAIEDSSKQAIKMIEGSHERTLATLNAHIDRLSRLLDSRKSGESSGCESAIEDESKDEE